MRVSEGDKMQDEKKRILIVHNYYQIPGGEDSVVANEKKMLEDHGHKVILYTRNNSDIKTMKMRQKIVLPFITIFNNKTYRDIKNLIKEKKIDIVHVHNTMILISPAVYYAALSCRVPVVQTMHNFRFLCPGATFYRDGHLCEECVKKGLWCSMKYGCYRGSRKQTFICVISIVIHRILGIYGKLYYICLTEFNKTKLLQLKQIQPNHVFVKPNFTYVSGIERQVKDYYLYIGRIEKIKGVNMLLRAFEMLPDRKLLLAGTGEELEELKDKYACYSNILFKNFLKKKDLNKLLAGAMAVIVTSQCYETFGLVIAEAFSCHIPVIVGNIGNIGSLVEDGVNGVKFQYNSVEALRKAIIRFENMDGKALGEAAYEKYLKEFAEDKNYFIIESIYNDVEMLKEEKYK